jgi:uncharacterized coiled-coil protein SlyX
MGNDNQAGLSDNDDGPELTPPPNTPEEEVAELNNRIQELHATIAQRDSTISKQKLVTADLKKKFRTLGEKKAPNDASMPAVVSGKATVGLDLYDVIVTGPNAGKMISHVTTKVTHNGKVRVLNSIPCIREISADRTV